MIELARETHTRECGNLGNLVLAEQVRPSGAVKTFDVKSTQKPPEKPQVTGERSDDVI